MPNFDRTITACTNHPISQEGSRCYLVSAALVLSKSEKLRKLLSPEDLQFLDRVFRLGGTNACPNPPNGLDQRYRYFYRQDVQCSVNDTRCLTSSNGGLSITVLKAFLSEQAPNQIVVPKPNFHVMNQSLKLGKIATYVRTHRLLLNRFVHEKGAVILNIEFPYNPPNADEARTPITKAFGRTLRRICSYNDNIVGGYFRCIRDASRAEIRQSDKPNDSWSKGMLQNYIRTINNSAQQWQHDVTGPTNRITVGGTKQDLRTKLQHVAHYQGHGRRTFGHAVGFTVCNQADEHTGVNNRALPTIVICNWDQCYRGDRKTEEFRNTLLRFGDANKTPYKAIALALILA